MQDDGPPAPNPGRFERTGSGQLPTWPAPDASDPLHQRYPMQIRRSSLLVGGLAVSVGANVALLVALVAVLALARAGIIAPRGSAGPSAPGTLTPSTTTGTTSPTPSPTPGAGWLTVTPSSVQLGCDSGQQTQFVVLTNTGSEDVHWQANLPDSGDNAAVSLGPTGGKLRAGTSVPIQIRNQSSGDSQQGVITFESSSSAAGQPASLSYTTTGC